MSIVEDDGSARRTRRTASDGRGGSEKAEKVADLPIETIGVPAFRDAIDTAFRNDEILTDALKSHLKTRTAAAEKIESRVATAFEDFSPSNHSKEDRSGPNYLAPTDELSDLLSKVAETGAKALKRADSNHGIRLARGDELNKLIKKPRAGATELGTIKLGDLMDYVAEGLAAGASPPLPDLGQCDPESEAERRLVAIENRNDGDDTDPAEDEDNRVPGAGEGPDRSTRTLVRTTVNSLMGTLVPPEARYQDEPPRRADDEEIARSIVSFELRDGPSDVTSYHDFNSLQIAFPHVWTEVFDGELETLGKELYREYVKLKEFAGVDDGKDDDISTVADLNRLIGDVQALSKLTQGELPAGAGGAGGGGSGGGRPAGGSDLRDNLIWQLGTGSFLGNDVVEWVLNPAGAVINLVGDLVANMQQINWDQLAGGLLPGGIDHILTTIEKDAIPDGQVEIVLESIDATATWKGIDFIELDSSGRPLDTVKISNHPHDTNRMQLRTARTKNAMLTFGKEITFGAHKAHYFLTDLDQKLTNRTRVTFKWIKDK